MKALVTGAGKGLGKAIAIELAATGGTVLASDRNQDQLEALAREHGVDFVTADLCERAQLDSLSQAAIHAGPFERVVLNAGINRTGPFESIPISNQLGVIETNLISSMILTASLIKNNAISPGGTIIFISSLSHFVGYPGAACYAASKSGLAVFARSITKPLKGRGINVLTVFPGPMDTDQASQNAPPDSDPSKRMAPERVAALILKRAHSSGQFVPGRSAWLMAKAGQFLPKLATMKMRRNVFEKLPGVKS